MRTFKSAFIGPGLLFLFVSQALQHLLLAQPSAGLAGYWRFDEGSGSTAADSSGNGVTGNLFNQPVWATGKIVAALDFDGTSDYFRAENAPAIEVGKNGEDFSVAFWFYLKRGNTGAYRIIMHKGSGNAERTFAMWMRPDNNRLYYRLSTTSTYDEGAASAALIPLNTWVHVAYVKAGSKLRLYLNGGLDSEVSLVGTVVGNTGPLHIGKDPQFAGTESIIDEVRLYRRALTSQEVQSFTTVPPPTVPAPDGDLVGYWKFDEGTGTTATDASGHGITGALIDAPVWTIGKVGGALIFDGLSDYFRAESAPVIELGKSGEDFTVAYWFYLRRGYTGAWREIMHKGSSGPERTFAMWMRPDSNRLHYRLSTTSSYDEGGGSAASIPLNTWVHVTYLKTGTKLRLYLNGALDSEVTLTGTVLSNTGPLFIGKDPWYAGVDSLIDEVRLYRRDLTPQEIQAFVGTSPPPSSPPPPPAPPPPPSPPGVVTLPIEVMGADGTIESRTVNLPSSVTSLGAISLWLQVHGLDYADKGSVQVNNSSWISLNNANSSVAIANPGKGYGGIGGGFATLKMTIGLPAGTVVPGANTVRFRFNFTDGSSIGYRVLKFNFLSSAAQSLLDASAFLNEDPGAWQPPRNTAAEIDQGKTLWYTAQLKASLKSPLLPGGSLIQARCTDCHAQDGRDLKYFNYSNRSIIERAKFHGLSTSQGELIASYIRSLNIVSPGRPWNPPYQPGPGLDSKPVNYWAAGAGVDWVLDRDEDALPFIFPGGAISSAVIAPTANLSARVVPIVMQLPDWNHWLPPIHPKDAWGANAFIANGSKLLSFYNGDVGVPVAAWSIARSVLKKGDAGSLASANWILASWVIERYTLMKTIGPAPWSGDEVSSQKVYATGLWQLTKMWELMQEFEMEALAGPTLFGPRAEPRTWTPSRLVFDVSPNIEQLPLNRHGINDNRPQTHRYFSMAWYHLQLILNNGNRSPSSGQSTQFPVDWDYTYGFLKDVVNDSGVPNAMHYYLWAVKGLQTIENGLGPDRYNSGGWNPHTINNPSHMVYYGFQQMWNNVSVATRKALIEAYLRNWIAKNKQYSPSQYYTGDLGGLTQSSHVPVFSGTRFADNVWTMFVASGPGNTGNSLNAYGIDKALQNEILDWAKTVWPLANWNSLRPP